VVSRFLEINVGLRELCGGYYVNRRLKRWRLSLREGERGFGEVRCERRGRK
jgi:hypothetical protein